MPKPLTNADLQQVTKRTFKGARVTLDGKNFDQCRFEGCVMVFKAEAPFGVVDSHFTNCQWTFEGAARMTIEMLVRMGQMPGMEFFVAQVADHIQGRGLTSRHPEPSA